MSGSGKDCESPKMRRVKPKGVKLKRRDEKKLKQLLAAGSTPQRTARRARIVLGSSEAQRVVRMVEKTELASSTIWRVCERYRQGGLEAALYDAQ